MIKIELRKISVHERLSEETACYTAELYVDGVKLGEVSNRGHGGADEFHPAPGKTWADYSAADARCKAELPPIACGWNDDDGTPSTLTADLELVCAHIVEDWSTAKRVKRSLARAVLYFQDGLPAEGKRGDLYEFTRKGTAPAALVPAVKAKYPNACILNELPEADAIAAYKRAA